MSGLRKGMKGRLPIQGAGWILQVKKEHAGLQTALKNGYLRKGLTFKSLLGNGLMMAFNPRMLQGWSLMDETHLHTQTNQSEMYHAWERRNTLVLVKGAIVIQTDLLWHPIPEEGASQDPLVFL